MPTYDQSTEAQRLRLILSEWVTHHPGWAQSTETTTWITQVRSAAEIARDLLETTEIAEVRLAGILGSPDGQLIQAVVRQVVPAPYSTEFKLLVDAVMLAAEAKQKNQQKRAALATAGVVVIGLAMIFGRS
jgi:hypothetical protein